MTEATNLPGVPPGEFRGLFAQSHMEGLDLKDITRRLNEADGIGASVKFDVRWNLLFPNKGSVPDRQFENQYKTALRLIGERPNQEPFLILDSPPDWVKDTLLAGNKDPHVIYDSYRYYTYHVAHMVKESGVKPSFVQVMNEVNNSLYNTMSLEMLGSLCRITRDTFTKEFGESPPIMLSFMADPSFLKKLGSIKDSFDVAGVDYYQGIYPTKYAPFGWVSPHPAWIFGDKRLLRELFEEFLEDGALAGKKIAFAEVGAPTPRGKAGERRQRLFYNQFFRSLNIVLNEYRQNNKRVPLVGIGLYGLEDQPQRPGSEFHTLFWPIQKLYNEHFERRFGVFRETGEAKSVVERLDYLVNKRLPSQLTPLHKPGK